MYNESWIFVLSRIHLIPLAAVLIHLLHLANSSVVQFLCTCPYPPQNRYRKVPEGGFKPNLLSGVTLLGCSTSVASDIAVNSKLTEMIASGVDFARDLVGMCIVTLQNL